MVECYLPKVKVAGSIPVSRSKFIQVIRHPLFDKSGGAGILPNEWPVAEGYAGYAGGLSPDNVEHELMRIQEARNGYPVWIDAETKLRSDDDKVFELYKVEEFVTRAYPWTI